MRVSQCVRCRDFPCADVRHEGYLVPGADLKPEGVSIGVIAEAAPPNPGDYFYAGGPRRECRLHFLGDPRMVLRCRSG